MWKLLSSSFSNSAGLISFGEIPRFPTYNSDNNLARTSSSSGATSSFFSSSFYYWFLFSSPGNSTLIFFGTNAGTSTSLANSATYLESLFYGSPKLNATKLAQAVTKWAMRGSLGS